MSVAALCEMLNKQDGYDVSVYTTTSNGKEELPVIPNRECLVGGVKVTYFRRITKDNSHFSPALIRTLWKTCNNYNIIHIHAWWNMVSILACSVAVLKKKKVIVSPRGTLSTYSFGNKKSFLKSTYHNLIGRKLLEKCNFVVTSEKEKNEILQLLQPKAIYIANNLVDFPEYKTSIIFRNINAPLKLLFLSRIEQKKGLEYLFEALHKCNFPYQLNIAGTGQDEYINELKQKVKQYNNERFINWLGGIYAEKKFEFLESHDLLVLPSQDENFANVVIESLAMGTPVLISENVGLEKYVREKKLGWVCKTNPGSIAEQLKIINESRGELDEIRSKAKKIIKEDFDKSKIVKDYLLIYEEILSKKKGYSNRFLLKFSR